MKTIPLTQGFVALVDDADYAAVSAFKWYAKRDGPRTYAARDVRDPKKRTLRLHKFLLPEATEVDHRDGDGLNNQRHNLRPATRLQNARNRRKLNPATSKFKGVHWHTQVKKWQARIYHQGKSFSLGLFVDEIEAARAFDTAAKEIRGDFSGRNFP